MIRLGPFRTSTYCTYRCTYARRNRQKTGQNKVLASVQICAQVKGYEKAAPAQRNTRVQT